ncbi:protein FAR-RED IMPAIRED RESPONSE 1-like [Humulus lupulus]|uniref:protein FAR-RED IMPAIRED RESPONSE 1-like n=1 Tax=Humulus lupulus TaxID=3486 RepID=UPI002B401A1A|nr:protein FAR-RED IMPAIRED RESPONSE 1-like [Humulus lupulus]
MNSIGIKTSQIMSHVALQFGGYEGIPCQVRDVYNRVVGAMKEEKMETDSEGALGFLDCLSAQVPNFIVCHQADEENRLANVFWVDETSRNYYMDFGDVIAFDMTYMNNTNNKPLCILMGVNHHFSTCIFGFALLVDETVTTYSWMLRVLLRCHNNKKPLVVLIDRDNAIQEAIRENILESTYRLCAWNLATNASRAGMI